VTEQMIEEYKTVDVGLVYQAWQVRSLVVSNKRCVVVVENKDDYPRYGGVRTTGSKADRKFKIESGESIKFETESDDKGNVELYAENEKVVHTFTGYWESTYEEGK